MTFIKLLLLLWGDDGGFTPPVPSVTLMTWDDNEPLHWDDEEPAAW